MKKKVEKIIKFLFTKKILDDGLKLGGWVWDASRWVHWAAGISFGFFFCSREKVLGQKKFFSGCSKWKFRNLGNFWRTFFLLQSQIFEISSNFEPKLIFTESSSKCKFQNFEQTLEKKFFWLQSWNFSKFWPTLD